MKEVIFEILNDMAENLTVAQLKKLQEVLLTRFSENENQPEPARNEDYLEMFIHAKQVEGLPGLLSEYQTVDNETRTTTHFERERKNENN